MAINTIPKEVPTGDSNPTAGGAINRVDLPTSECNDKAFLTLRAKYALKGHQLHRTDPTDGLVTYWVERCGLVRYLPSKDSARQYLEQIGGAL